MLGLLFGSLLKINLKNKGIVLPTRVQVSGDSMIFKLFFK